MPSERRHLTSRFRFYSAIEDLNGDLVSYRKDPAGSEVTQQSVQETELAVSAQNKLVSEQSRLVQQEYNAVRKGWPLLLKSFENWQLLETKYPGESHPTFELMKFSEFRTTSAFEPNPRIGDLCGLRPITSDEIDICVREAADGDRVAVERLGRLRHYHRTIYETISELLGYCSDDLYQLIVNYYTVPRETFDQWVQELLSHRRIYKPFNLVTELLVHAISLASIELIIWRQLSTGLDRRTRYFKAIDKNANRVEKLRQRLERILNAYRKNACHS